MASPLSLVPSQPSHRATDAALTVAWQNPRTRKIAPIGQLDYLDGQYTFAYLRSARTVEGFRPLLGFPDFSRRYTADRLFPIFSQRLMGTGRPDFARYLDLLRLSADASPLGILGRSGGRREGDSLFLLQRPAVADDGSSRSVFFVHGVRHTAGASERITALATGDELLLEPEPQNPANAGALLVAARDSAPLGYVPDLLLDYVHQLRQMGGPEVTVLQVNSEDSPPNLRLLVQCTGQLPPAYVPFSGGEWDTAISER
jgi:hypothetical protein